jgi:uncharacterized protein YjbI with pentapeptide repeats
VPRFGKPLGYLLLRHFKLANAQGIDFQIADLQRAEFRLADADTTDDEAANRQKPYSRRTERYRANRQSADGSGSASEPLDSLAAAVLWNIS